MRYRITGACGETGRDMTVELVAANEAEATQQAEAMNLLIAVIEPVAIETHAHTPIAQTHSQAADDLTRRLNSMRVGSAPDYFWLKLIGHTFTVFGFLAIVLTLLINLLMLVGIVEATSRNVAGLAAFGGLVVVVNVLIGVLFGAFMLAVGQSLLAFRDIARHSWKLPQIVELLK
jgi:hypothetical protein